LKKIRVQKAVGMALAHDVTRIVPGEFKGVGFRKGHIIREEDIPELLKIGKQSVYVLEVGPKSLHEDDAAFRIAKAISGSGLSWSEPKEGKITFKSDARGILKVKQKALLKINRMESIIVSTLKNNFPCSEDSAVAATRIIPLTIPRGKIERLETIAEEHWPVISVLPYRRLKVGAVVTGTEVYSGLVGDGFDQYVGAKIKDYGSEVVQKIVTPDGTAEIAQAIRTLKDHGCELIVTTGGLSVDPDDVTRAGVRRSGARIVVYGSPILPGAMFLYAVLDGTIILGLPACVYYHDATVFDLMLPRVLAGDPITKNDVAALGHGGFCMNCNECRYPVCPFGK
jgi:hypothetical protein